MDAEQDGVKLTDKEIADNGLLFFLAGHDTSSITLTHCLYLLALNQTVQETLHKEIDGLFATGQEINYDTIGQLEYIDCVIKETLRLIPTAARTSRIASRDTILGKAKVPKGTMVLISNHAIHQDASHFEDPEQFIPERFDKNSKLGHNPQAFVPFAPGPRNCIGERFAMFEMKLCLIRVLRMFKFEPCSTTKVPLDYYIGNMVFQPKEVYLRPVERHL
ncbi:Cytochrome P450 3A21 [Halotydeus destructor]|nr:Cytochrome P450 3A21 [Halotydeus destructor]